MPAPSGSREQEDLCDPQSAIRPVVPSTVSVYFDDNGTGLPGALANNVWCLSRDDSQPMPIGAGCTVRVHPR